MGEWPEFYPDDCPPEDAEDTEGVVFHLVTDDPIPESDLYDTAYHRDAFASLDECKRVSLSSHREKQDLQETKSTVPRLSDRKIAKADLDPEFGKIKQTFDPSHHSLWIREEYYSNANEWFEVVEG
jgi:hypothetical protein